MIIILNSLFPVFAIILFGYFAKHYKFLESGFWHSCERLSYYILLPILLYLSIATGSYKDITVLTDMIKTGILSLIITCLLVFCCKYIFNISSQDFTSITTGTICPNGAFIGIPIAIAIFGKEYLATYALLLGCLSITSNAIAVIILSYYSHNSGNVFICVIKRTIRHPQIIACLLGIISSYMEINLPKSIFSTLEIISKAAIPMGLIIVGGALDIKAIRGSWNHIYLTSFLKLAIYPIVSLFCIKLFNISSIQAKMLMLYSSLPTGTATYLLVKNMRGNSYISAGIIVLTTILAFFTMLIILNYAI